MTDAILEFYYGTGWHWPVPYLPRVMLSYNMIRHLKHPWTINKPWMLDSGAYAIMLQRGSYQWTVQDYANSIGEWKPDIAWTMDYPCEPAVRAHGRYTVRQAQEKTNQNTVELERLGVKVSNVVQGWNLDEYMQNLDLIKERGLLTERFGIGSICRRGKTSQISRIIRAVHREVPSWVKLHGFGVKISILSTDNIHRLYSADSISWNIERRYYSWTKNNNKGLKWQQKVPALLSYISKIKRMTAPDEHQTSLISILRETNPMEVVS